MNKSRPVTALLSALLFVPTLSYAFSWTEVSGPATPSNQRIFGLAEVANNDVWAVGDASNGNVLIEHWDGTAWTPVLSPVKRGGLTAVAALAPDNIWAAGLSTDAQGGYFNLVEHWDGAQWVQVPAPSVGTFSTLSAISIVSNDDIWAVGSSSVVGGQSYFLMHWDGSTWTLVDGPPVAGSSLDGIKAFASNDVWAVGRKNIDPNTGNRSTFTLHFDGTAWSEIPSPDVDTINELFGIDGASSSDIWAVGDSTGFHTLALHWDGSAWSVVPTPPNGASFRAVKVINSNQVLAVGYGGGPLIEAWNGRKWRIMPTPGFSVDTYLYAVSYLGKGAWSAGYETTRFPRTDSFFLMSTRNTELR